MLPPRPCLAALLSALLLAAGNAVAAQALSPLALSCQGCHQAAVNAGTMPSLAGYPADKIAASLRAARETPQPGSIMARFAQYLSDAEIDGLAADAALRRARLRNAAMPSRCSGRSSSTAMCEDTMSRWAASARSKPWGRAKCLPRPRIHWPTSRCRLGFDRCTSGECQRGRETPTSHDLRPWRSLHKTL